MTEIEVVRPTCSTHSVRPTESAEGTKKETWRLNIRRFQNWISNHQNSLVLIGVHFNLPIHSNFFSPMLSMSEEEFLIFDIRFPLCLILKNLTNVISCIAQSENEAMKKSLFPPSLVELRKLAKQNVLRRFLVL